MKLLISSRNENKIHEIREILGRPGLDILSAADVPGLPDVEEDGDTFAANAVKKARELCRKTGMWTIADDSGLEVDALGGAPGVLSARYAGEHGRDADNNAKLLGELKDIPDRGAQFHCAIALASPDGGIWIAEGICRGRLIDSPRGTGGFGYDPLFVPDGFDKTFAELGSDVKNRISHRAKALAKAKATFPDIAAQSQEKHMERKFKATVLSPSLGDITLSCDDPGPWSFSFATDGGSPEILTVSIESPDDAPPPSFVVAFSQPIGGTSHIWTPSTEHARLPPDWGGWIGTSQFGSGAPLFALLGQDDETRLVFSCSESSKFLGMRAGVREEDARIWCSAHFFTEAEAPMRQYSARIRLDCRREKFCEAIRMAAEWLDGQTAGTPCVPPSDAFAPLYSSWYAFHQNVFDREIERECAAAAKDGMKVIILDDGWQTDDNNRGYAFCGDWEVSRRRFPDMRAHVARVHALGMKYMVWFSVPFVGRNSANYGRFKGKYLTDDTMGAGVLDPRFPETREFIVATYERALREWDIDGFKLDFIDSFRIYGRDPAAEDGFAGRDIRSLSDAVGKLLSEIHERLEAIKPGLLFEFRQSYIGPAIRRYGNMLRAGDCPGDIHANRARTVNLRLTSIRTAVHSDMLEWNVADRPEEAARQILAVLFAVVQYSMVLSRLPESHRAMMRHWIGFTQKHRAALLEGALRAEGPAEGYPVVRGDSADETIIAVYGSPRVCRIDDPKRTVILVNATSSDTLFVDLPFAPATAEAFDTFGNRVETEIPGSGLQAVKVPVSGYLLLR